MPKPIYFVLNTIYAFGTWNVKVVKGGKIMALGYNTPNMGAPFMGGPGIGGPGMGIPNIGGPQVAAPAAGIGKSLLGGLGLGNFSLANLPFGNMLGSLGSSWVLILLFILVVLPSMKSFGKVFNNNIIWIILGLLILLPNFKK